MLKLSSVCFEYKNFSINNIDLIAEKDQIVCLIGSSGCGKSTLFSLISGFRKIKKGKITINGINVDDGDRFVDVSNRYIGVVLQYPSLLPNLNILDNILFGIDKNKESIKHVSYLLDYCGIKKYINSMPDTLSGGQQQIIAILRALIYKPNLLLLDEAFNSMDSVFKRFYRNYIKKLLKEYGVTTLLITHDHEEAMSMADTIYVMEDGSIIQSGSPCQIYQNPSSLRVAGFFGEINFIKGRYISDNFQTVWGILSKKNDQTLVIRPEGIMHSDSVIGIKCLIVDIDYIHYLLYLKIKNSNERYVMRIIRNANIYKIDMEISIVINRSLIISLKTDDITEKMLTL